MTSTIIYTVTNISMISEQVIASILRYLIWYANSLKFNEVLTKLSYKYLLSEAVNDFYRWINNEEHIIMQNITESLRKM
jgi:hypothetical protein